MSIDKGMTESTQFLSRSVSYQENVKAAPVSQKSIDMVLGIIRQEKLAGQIGSLRALLGANDKKRYDLEKKNLPCVTFSGTFTGRRKVSNLSKYTELLVLDIDHIETGELGVLRAALKDDSHILSVWTSPSGHGLKGLVPLRFSDELCGERPARYHAFAFSKVSEYVLEKHGVKIDQSGSDVTRLCFLSSDRGLHLRQSVDPFVVSGFREVDDKQPGLPGASTRPKGLSTSNPGSVRAALYRTEGKNRQWDRQRMASLLKFLEKRELSITGTYQRWMLAAFAIANTFSYNIGEAYYLRLCRLDGLKHDEAASKQLLQDCYLKTRGEVGLGTILHFARDLGYD